jgi:pyruvate/2-oxoglutarate dehydrogenase complex dihydrolipoamide dehydrogenase (E3) component
VPARLEFSRVIVATGATDRILPVPGWTLPGVYSLGAAQIALKFQGCAIGERVVFAGSGPLLYLVAYQYAKAGAKVVAVLDSSPFSCPGPRPARPAVTAGDTGQRYLLPRLAHGPWYPGASGREH